MAIINRRTFLGAGAALTGMLAGSVADETSAEEKQIVKKGIYTDPFIDFDEWRDAPVRHRYVHGGFKGTELLYSFYFPPKEHYQGRFFQPLQAVSGNENMAPMAMYQAGGVGFALASGGYLVESNQGSRNMFGGSAEANAAVAEYSRELAADMYGKHRPFGYVYGGSGGAFKTLGCVENTSGVWDGSIPFVHGTPVSIPYFFTVQAHAMRILGPKFPQIVDALDPGGSGDMYAGLNEEERDALREVTRFGFPPRAWFNFQKIAFGYTGVFTTLVDRIVDGDPTYFQDFWSKPGYLGFNSPESLKQPRFQHPTKIAALVMPDEARKMGLPLTMPAAQTQSGVNFPAALRIADPPQGNLQGASIIVKSGGAKGHTLYIAGVVRDLVMIGFGAGHFEAMAALRAGDEIQIDNSIYLATQTYHRHQIPAPEYYVWNQYKGADGKPLYPQRPLLPGQEVQSGGATQSGRFHGKVIVMQALWDEAAYPWSADWYRTRVKAALGPEFEDRYRLWYVDNTMHTTQVAGPNDPRPVATTRVISYQGVLQQALRDLAAWVEKGVAPPESTAYEVRDGQIVVPSSAAARKGIQPVVTLTANGAARAEVIVGEKVQFTALIDVPPETGTLVAAEWDFEGAGDYPVAGVMEHASASPSSATVRTSYAFSAKGTYFPALRATSQRQGDATTPYARVQNLGRVRVVVA
ncbi:MAG TPA: hypothetical protein VJO53_11905 [Candidatus Acidoferrales bacterium]|nr:hypothetical protein [Candidatus Acidoferrales bacterium]